MQNNRASPTPTSVAVLRRRTAVFIITVVVSAPFALFLVVLGLVVVEYVIFPTATLATGVIAALVAGWAASRLAGDGYRTDIGAVAWRNLAWAIIPAAAAALPFLDVLSPGLLTLVVVFYTALGATLFAFRHRTPDTSIPRDLRITAAWLGGTVIAVVLIIMVASVFGLTGA